MAIQTILTDIEGTTSSVSFVYEVLFPYFRKNLAQIVAYKNLPEVNEAFEETCVLAFELEEKVLTTDAEIVDQLMEWSLADKKITPLKTIQGIIWEKAYKSGEIKGHVYPDVPPAFEHWKNLGLDIFIYSSGSVAAQKLIFGYSDFGDLSTYLSGYFDTKTGGKREKLSYEKIAEIIGKDPADILFLSDIVEELEAADEAGFQTVQLVREGIQGAWKHTVSSFHEIQFDSTRV